MDSHGDETGGERRVCRCSLSGLLTALGRGRGGAWCRLGAVCRIRCRYVPLCAAICRSLECNLLVFLGFVFSSQAEGRGFDSRLALHRSSFSSWNFPILPEFLMQLHAGAGRLRGPLAQAGFRPDLRIRADRASKLRFRSRTGYGALCQVPSGACGGSANTFEILALGERARVVGYARAGAT